MRRSGGAVAVGLLLLTAACGAAAGEDAPASLPAAESSVPSAEPLAFTASTLDGTELDVGSLAGTPVVLWFWAPWCTICRAEAPDVAAVAASLDEDVTFLGVPGLGPVEDMQRFVEDTGTGDLVHVVDSDGSIWRRFGVVAQPSFVFVAPDGSTELFGGALGADALRSAAAELTDG